MATSLHSIEVLASVADGEPGLARDWATSRLALAGVTPPGLPDDLVDAEVCLAAAPDGVVDLVIEALRRGQSNSAYLALRLGAYGLLPESDGLAQALRASLGSGDVNDLLMVFALSQLEEVSKDELRVAAEASGRDQLPWIVPTLLLKSAGPGDLEDTALAIAKGFGDDGETLRAILVHLGVPMFESWLIDPDDAVALGAELAGRDRVPVRKPKGGAARREQAWVRTLLHNHPGPAAALLRAIYQRRGPSGLNGGLGAGWLRMAQTTEPVDDVLRGGFGADPRHLSAARRALTPDDAPRILKKLVSPSEPVAVLASAIMGDHPSLSKWFVDALRDNETDMGDRSSCIRWQAASLQPDAVEGLLRDEFAWPSGVMLARYVHTEEILAMLLQRGLPWETEQRVELAMALAGSADPAAAQPLQDLCTADSDPRISDARRLLERLLNQRL